MKKQWWINKIVELAGEVGGTTIALNRENWGDYAIGYYYDKETGKFNVYENVDRGEQDIYLSTDDEAEALKKVYNMVRGKAEMKRRDFRRRSNINVKSEDLRTKITQDIVGAEAQWWTDKVNELADEAGGIDIALNRKNGGAYAIGYYYDEKTGKFNVYENEDRGERNICKSTYNEVEALKAVYDLVHVEMIMNRRSLIRKSNITKFSENLRTKITQDIVGSEKQWWAEKIQELTDEIGPMDVVLNRYTEAEDTIGYYFNKETGKFDVYKTLEREMPKIRASVENEVDALKEVYRLIRHEAEMRHLDLCMGSGIQIESVDMRKYIADSL